MCRGWVSIQRRLEKNLSKIDLKIYDLLSNEFEEYKSEKNVLDKINIQKRKEIEAKELLNQEIEVAKDTEVKKD